MAQILVMLDGLRSTAGVLCVHGGGDLEVGRRLLLLLLLLGSLGGPQGLVAAQPDGLLDEADQAVLVAENILQGRGESINIAIKNN